VPDRFTASGNMALPDQWWKAFNDPALNTLVEQALSGNLTIKAAYDRLLQAEAAAKKAGADISPDLDFKAGISRIHNRSNSTTTDIDNFELGLSAGYELDIRGRIKALTTAAGFDAKASATDLKAVAMTLSSQVAAAWYQLVETCGQMDLLDRQLETNKKTLDLITLQFRTGQVSSSDVLQQKQLIESKKGEKAKAQGNARVLKNQLAVLLGIAPDHWTAPVVISFKALSPLPDTGLPADLVNQRPDILAAYFRVKAANHRTAAAIADRFPRISLSSSLETSGADASDLFNDWLASLAANLIAPLIDGGRRKAEADRTRAASMEALHDYGQKILTAFGEVEDALAVEDRQTVFISSLDRQVGLAAQVVERVRNRYIKGVENYQRVLTALLSHQQLESARLTAKRDLVLNRVRLCRAIGGGWQTLTQNPMDNTTLQQSK
ncbi:MAG: efflux transporter outer membrane subunit, partial [Desulfobacterales bacterium]|nr:efflux transporter outer membrane subunit [Desulfobacterales bacterium]